MKISAMLNNGRKQALKMREIQTRKKIESMNTEQLNKAVQETEQVIASLQKRRQQLNSQTAETIGNINFYNGKLEALKQVIDIRNQECCDQEEAEKVDSCCSEQCVIEHIPGPDE